MNNEGKKITVFNDLKFITIGVVTLISFTICLSMMFYYLDIRWKPNELSTYTTLIETFNLPLNILTAGIAALSLYAVFYRLKLTEHQILQTQKQLNISQQTSTLSQYLEHRKFVYEELEQLETLNRYALHIPNKNKIYMKLFPNNSPRHFELPIGTDEATYSSHILLDDWQNKVKIKLDEIDKIEENENIEARKMLFHSNMYFLLLDLSDLGVSFKSDYSIGIAPVSANGSYFSTISAILAVYKKFSELTFYNDFYLSDSVNMKLEPYFEAAVKLNKKN